MSDIDPQEGIQQMSDWLDACEVALARSAIVGERVYIVPGERRRYATTLSVPAGVEPIAWTTEDGTIEAQMPASDSWGDWRAVYGSDPQ